MAPAWVKLVIQILQIVLGLLDQYLKTLPAPGDNPGHDAHAVARANIYAAKALIRAAEDAHSRDPANATKVDHDEAHRPTA